MWTNLAPVILWRNWSRVALISGKTVVLIKLNADGNWWLVSVSVINKLDPFLESCFLLLLSVLVAAKC